MSKTTLMAWCLLALVAGLIWVVTWHLTGLAAVVLIGLPLVLAALSAVGGGTRE